MALVNYNGKNVLGVCKPVSGDIVRLLPGINEVDNEDLKIMKAHPLFQSRMKAGMVQIMAEPADKDGKRTVDEMLTNIPKIFDLKLLKKIVETDGRDKVVQAAREQMEKIKNPSKAKADEEDEHFK